MSGVVSFLWTEDGRAQYARVPRDEIRTVRVHHNMISIGMSVRTEINIPFDGGDDEAEVDIEPWPEVQSFGLTSASSRSLAHRSYTHMEWCDKMFEALTMSIDIDCTFRWNGTTWEYSEGRPT